MSDHMPPEPPERPEDLGEVLPAPPDAQMSEVPPASSATDAPKRRRGRAAVIALIAVLVLAGGAAAAGYLFLRGAPEAVLDKVPATADVVVVAHLDPGASQKMNLFRMTDQFPVLGTREELFRQLNGTLDDMLTGSGLTHDDLSWVGGEAGGYVDINSGSGTPAYAVLIATDDTAATSDTMRAVRDSSGASYQSVEIDGVESWVATGSDQPAMAVVDGVAVFASDEDEMRAVILTASAGGDGAIANDPIFEGVMDRLPADNLGFAYMNYQQLLEAVTSLPGFGAGSLTGLDQLQATQGLGIALSAGPDGLSLDSVTTTDPSKLTPAQTDSLAASDGPNPLIDLVPADAYAMAALSGAATGVDQALEQVARSDPKSARMLQRLHLVGPDGVLNHLTGNLAYQVGPGTGLLPVGGSVLIGVDDADAVQSWLDANLQRLLDETNATDAIGAPWKTEDYNGVTITYTESLLAPVGVAYGVVDGALVIATSPKSVEQAVDLSQGAGGIATDPSYATAIGAMPGSESVTYIDVQAILTAVQAVLPGEAYQQFLDAGGRNLQPITAVAAGSESDENGSSARFLIQIP